MRSKNFSHARRRPGFSSAAKPAGSRKSGASATKDSGRAGRYSKSKPTFSEKKSNRFEKDKENSFDRPSGDKPWQRSKRVPSERDDSSTSRVPYKSKKRFDEPERRTTGTKPRRFQAGAPSSPSTYKKRGARTDGPVFRNKDRAKGGRPAYRDQAPAMDGGDARGQRKWNRQENHEFYGERKNFGKKNFSDRPGKNYNWKTAKKKQVNVEAEVNRQLTGEIRLNKYISNAGICSRREADKLIESGAVSVNGEIITTLGFKVKQGDNVQYGGQRLKNEKPVYLLLNKPKDYITTVDDPHDRKTVMALIQNACNERVYPVGRLDRNTTGLLLFTNDGALADKLTHPSFQIQKVYEVHLDKNLKAEDLEAVSKGINLEDGFIKPDEVSYSPASKSIVGIELHSGRNRIVRRIFEYLGYKVIKLDRVLYAGLTKKDLPRGKWKFLSPLEIANLKMLSGKRKRIIS